VLKIVVVVISRIPRYTTRGRKSVCGLLDVWISIVERKALGLGLGLCVATIVIRLPFGLKSQLYDMYMSAAST